MLDRAPITAPRRVEVFAVGVDDAQIAWRSIGTGPVSVERDGVIVTKGATAELGVVVVDDLDPGSRHRFVVRPADGPAQELVFDTLDPPPGSPTARFATLSDLHLGAGSFGLFGRIRDDDPEGDGHSWHCATAAVAEAVDWGAERLYVKGDLTHHSRPGDWTIAGRFLDSLPIPHHLILGNHDVQYRRQAPPAESLRRLGRDRTRVHVVDHPGLRVILADFSTDSRTTGTIGADADAVLAAADVDAPVLLATHFHFQRTPVPWFWPLGIGYRPGRRFIDALRAINPRLVLTSGHTHRNRRYHYQGIPITEVGSPKDYPGVWAGYTVYEGGLVQTVRRVAAPAALSWTDGTRRAVGGAWGLWSPGTVSQRNMAHTWPV